MPGTKITRAHDVERVAQPLIKMGETMRQLAFDGLRRVPAGVR